MSDIPKIIASKDPNTGSSGFTNYSGGADVPAGLARVWAQFPGAVVLDGTDDWSAERKRRPESLVRFLVEDEKHLAWPVKPLAWFHTGISGISSSGAVFKEKDMVIIREYFPKKFGCELETCLKVYTQEVPV